MNYWLMKSEPDECSIDDVLAAPERKTAWSGVRNYQARNFMRDGMRVGDGVFFYHSSCDEVNVDVRALKKTKLVSLAELRRHKALARMRLLRPGNRLSITPVSAAEWKYITERLI
jgi:predicted RNA-binding protein with PUA-like domain